MQFVEYVQYCSGILRRRVDKTSKNQEIGLVGILFYLNDIPVKVLGGYRLISKNAHHK